MAKYDPTDPYWIVYQYSHGGCPYIYTTTNKYAYRGLLKDEEFKQYATVIKKSHEIHELEFKYG